MASATATFLVSNTVLGPTTTNNPADLWVLAFQKCKARIPEKQLARVLQVQTFEQLKAAVESLQKIQGQRHSLRALKRIDPFLLNIKSFSSAIDTMVQANPNIAALCWGGIKIVLELSIRVTKAFERVTEGMSRMGSVLPRVEAYQRLLPSRRELNQAMLDSFVRSLWDNYEDVLQKKLDQMEAKSRLIDEESHVAKLFLDEKRHKDVKSSQEEIKNLIKQGPTKMVPTLPCHSIPFIRNLNFFGRADELQACQNALKVTTTLHHIPTLVLYGIGGVGKTSIALEFIYQQKTSRKILLWISADDPTKIDDAFARAASKLGLHVENADAKRDREEVKNFLEHTVEPWLIVFDNVEDETVGQFFPNSGNGACLLTTRDPDIYNRLAVEGQNIQSFKGSDARDFLLKQLPAVNSTNVKEQAAVDGLSIYLGGSALGLKQIGSFIRETNCGIEDLLKALHDKDQEKHVLNDQQSLRSAGYDRQLATAWNHSLSSLSETTLNLLVFLSFMDPDHIQDYIIKELKSSCARHPQLFPEAADNIKFGMCLRTLKRYGLVEQRGNDNSFSVHRLIQTITLHFTSIETKAKIFDFVIVTFLQKHPQSQATSDTLFPQWKICKQYSTHIFRLHVLIKEWRLRPASEDLLWRLLFNGSRYLLETGWMKKCLSVVEVAESFCNPDTVEGKLRLAYLTNARGIFALQHQNLAEARSLFERVEQIRLEHLGELDPNTIAVQNNLALTLVNERRWQDVVTLNDRRRRLIADRDDVPLRLRTSIFDGLCSAYLEMGLLNKAMDAINTSINMSKATLPLISQLSGYHHYHKGKILTAQGKLEEALEEHLLCYRIRNEVLNDHVQTAGACYRAGDLSYRNGKAEEAIALLEESKRMYKSLDLIGSFPLAGSARSAWRLSEIMAAQGDSLKAHTYLEEAQADRDALQLARKDDLCENDFNILLNYVDS
ncbi:hypothetical protein EDD37DRAFT_676913 [Exophiala viscosa]|uniref:NB-ARC domain-containing protein n=1 Tax=Exophiala viscosa TaxID=2486360 RepID=A0AAN6E4S9_9EURO|nr:hypothetical protein EDD36DRAFT_459646 [Exophiala viscosa]KAI1627115.1 hypothetical protein EDD37DRAFT_676913 [Exophiala viscosa]